MANADAKGRDRQVFGKLVLNDTRLRKVLVFVGSGVEAREDSCEQLLRPTTWWVCTGLEGASGLAFKL